MPILQVRSLEYCLETTYPNIPDLNRLIREYEGMGGEIVHYPANFSGDITPVLLKRVRPFAQYLLEVNSSGEEAIFSVSENDPNHNRSSLTTPPAIYSFEHVMTKFGPNEPRNIAYIMGVNPEQTACLIGGIVTYAAADLIPQIRETILLPFVEPR